MRATPVRRLTTVSTSLVFVAVSLGGAGAAQAAEPVAEAGRAGVTQAVVRAPLASGSVKRDRFEAKVLRLTNKARAKPRTCGSKRMKKARKLRWSPALASSAHAHSTDMAIKDYFSHYTPSGVSPFERMRSAGYDYRAAGENIAAGSGLAKPKAVVKAWLRSPGHCKILMSRKFRDLGVGRVKGPGTWGVYWTQNFGRRR